MCYELKTNNGCTEAVIDDNCGISKFYAIAKNQFLTLHYNIFNGVSIYPQQATNTKSDNKIVMEVAHFLQKQAY